MTKWKDTSLNLGERCLQFALNEFNNKVAEDKPNSFTSPRLREYFKICTRLINGKEVPIGATFRKGNWCAAAVSFCLHESLLPNEKPPHGYRLGVVEIIADMQKQGTYRSIQDVRKGNYLPKVGDVIFYDRSRPNEPATAWYRHIGRVLEVGGPQDFVCLSGNSMGKWRINNHKFTQPALLGFGEYSTASTVLVPESNVDESWQNVNIEELAPLIDTGDDLDVSDFWDLFKK